ncbi:endonuclease/exonuclease/phosphatase family protein [Sphingomicrobium sediminis]|uniref:Endonuclease/exonuclease/phosphatase family protein n=1 Tax=Sphingomicrobium sediminis TaxID=2950949 RepID=A0A9X2EMJ6_9SPHN|nr:endonuclease/exonuclease/phosphatase family protein [Sphingomicrobium sediminis]MCM8558154.1 endonuclease/exonuclease/phosphatase family protein [Sphingomicrobium sediminis]
MQFKLASFNIRKAIGTDRKRDPSRILRVLDEIEPDIVVLQEADKRVGTRGAAVPHDLIGTHGRWRPVPAARSHDKLLDLVPDHRLTRGILDGLDTRNLGWHGNAILVRDDHEVSDAMCLDLPSLEPRGAIMADLAIDGHPLRIIGAHLDLSGLYRRRQVAALIETAQVLDGDLPAIIAADTNEWRPSPNSLDGFDPHFRQARLGPTYHTRRPMAPLDRIFVDRRLGIAASGVHKSAAARAASDHFPVWATINLKP